jgi:hypothetical protein
MSPGKETDLDLLVDTIGSTDLALSLAIAEKLSPFTHATAFIDERTQNGSRERTESAMPFLGKIAFLAK